jgi:hypothetical protein
VHGRQGLGRSNKELAFSSLSAPRPPLQMSDEHSDCTFLASSIVLLSKLDDGFCHGLVLTQTLIVAAVLLSQRRPVSSWHCTCLSPSALCCAAIPPCSVGAGVSRLNRAFIAAW